MCSRPLFKCSKSVSFQFMMPTHYHVTHKIPYIFLIIRGWIVMLGCKQSIQGHLHLVLTLSSFTMLRGWVIEESKSAVGSVP